MPLAQRSHTVLNQRANPVQHHHGQPVHGTANLCKAHPCTPASGSAAAVLMVGELSSWSLQVATSVAAGSAPGPPARLMSSASSSTVSPASMSGATQLQQEVRVAVEARSEPGQPVHLPDTTAATATTTITATSSSRRASRAGGKQVQKEVMAARAALVRLLRAAQQLVNSPAFGFTAQGTACSVQPLGMGPGPGHTTEAAPAAAAATTAAPAAAATSSGTPEPGSGGKEEWAPDQVRLGR